MLMGLGLSFCTEQPLDEAEIAQIYGTPLPPPDRGLAVYHLGHSLVGRDIPAMLAQLAGDGHSYHSQLGSFAELRGHWEPDIEVRDFDRANDHPLHRPAREAVASGDYDALILTERIDIEVSLRERDTVRYFGLWAEAARAARPGTRVYLYEIWHSRDNEARWLKRLEQDPARYWEPGLMDAVMAADPERRPVYVIPGGQVFAALARRLEQGPVGRLSTLDPFFRDRIHLTDHGHYLIALTHYAVLYGHTPVGLPHRLQRADGSPAEALDEDTAAALQALVWEVVIGNPRTGVAGP